MNAPRSSLLALATSLLLAGCGMGAMTSPGGGTAARTPTALTQASTGTLSVELLTFGPLAVGQNRVFYRVTSGGQPVTAAALKQRPVMHMADMTHGCPVVDPAGTADGSGLFEGLLLPTMASSADENWTLGLEVTVGTEATVVVDFGQLPVADSALKKILTRVDGRKVILTFGFPDGVKVGSNAVLVTAHEPLQMGMSYPPVEDLQLTVVPEMPSMGHGSSGNVAPTHAGDGMYRGTVNFSMAGDWVVKLGVKSGEADLGALSFAFDL